MFEEGKTEVVRGLRRYELDSAVRHIVCALRENGFMMAWQNTRGQDPIGFCHLSSIGNWYVAVYASASSRSQPLVFTSALHEGYDGHHPFVTQHLRTSAKAIGISFAALTNGLAREHSLWRFKSFIDGAFDNRWQDNSIAWRALWGRLVECLTRLDVGDLSDAVRKQLMHFAAEGQIVLDR